MRIGNFVRRRWVVLAIAFCAVVLVARLLVPNPRENESTSRSADKLLRRMIQSYVEAESYRDDGKIRGIYSFRGEHRDIAAPYAVQFIRPNRCRVRAYQVTAVSDGNRFRARIVDQSSPELAAQVLDLPAPNQVTMSTLRAAPLIRDLLDGGAGGEPIVVRLLTEDEPLAEIFDPSIPRQLLKPKKIHGQNCQRVEIATEAGSLVFWIDEKSYELRRLDYPPSGHDTIIAEFHGARLGARIRANAFQMPLPKNVKLVRHFVLPPQPLVSNLLGEKIRDFSFTDDASQKSLVGKGEDGRGHVLSRSSMRGKCCVLMWFNNHPGCRAALKQLASVYQQYRNEDRLVFRVIWAEGSSISELELGQLMDQWDVGIPIIRDLEATGQNVFGIPATPALIVLDSNSTVQVFDIGLNPDVARRLPKMLDDILDGSDIAAEMIRQRKVQRGAYEKQLAMASVEGEITSWDLPKTEIVRKSEPKQLGLTLLWTCDEIDRPGNIHVLDDSNERPTILVHDGTRSVVEIDIDGQVVQRHDLPLPDDAAVTDLRAATDEHGRQCFVALKNLSRQVFVFDPHWRLQARYPNDEQDHEGVRDAQIADLDGNGSLEVVVGFWGLVGLHAFDLSGSRIWSNRYVAPVLSLALSPIDNQQQRKVLATSDRGLIVAFNSSGNQEPGRQVGARSIYHIASAYPAKQTTASYCGLAYSPDGTHWAVALDSELVEQWSYPLPPPTHQNPIRTVISGRFLSQDSVQWLMPCADGSIHIVTENGDFFDYFYYGKRLHGLAATRWNDQAVLLVATEGEVVAWAVNRD